MSAASVDSAGAASVESYLREIATARNPPELALRACASRYDEAGPALRALLERAAACDELSESDATLLFRGLYIAGACRDHEAFEPLLRLLRLSEDHLESLLGDGLTEDGARIVASVFNGDVDALFDAIVDRERREWARSAVFGATTFLTFDGRIDRERTVRFLERFCEERLAEAEDRAWVDCVNAIALLGLRSHVPLVDRIFSEGRLPWRFMERRHFDGDLAEAEARPDDVRRFEQFHLGYIRDVVDALQWTRRREDETEDLSDDEGCLRSPRMFSEPIRNLMRHVGRNDPCPCGSGKKAKRCCLAAG